MKKITNEIRFASGFVIALSILFVAGAQLYRSLNGYIENSHWVAHTYQVLGALDSVKAGIFQLESGQRTYVITGDVFYLAEHDREEDGIRAELDRINELTKDNPLQQLRSAHLAQAVEERLRLLDRTIALFRNEGFNAARERIRSGVSHLSTETVLRQIELMDDEERGLLKQRNDLEELSARHALVTGGLLVLVAIAGLILLVWTTVRESKKRGFAEKTVQQNEILLKQILEVLPVGIFVSDAAGQITRINPGAREIWGGDRYVSLGQYGEYQGWWPNTGKPIAASEWALARTLRDGESVRDEVVDIRCFDGKRKTITNSTTPIRDESGRIVGGVAVNVDVTAFKRTEWQLRAAAHYDETQGQALALFSTSFDRQKVFDGLLELLARKHSFPVSALYAFDEWTGHYRCEAEYGLDTLMVREFVLGQGLLGQAALSGKAIVLDCADLTIQTGLAAIAPAQILMIPVSYQERRLAVLVLAASTIPNEADHQFLDRLVSTFGGALHNLRQYNDLKQLAEQVRTSNEEIAAKNLQLEEASRMKSEFLANMSHELRTPLNAIIGFSEIMRDGLVGSLTPQQRECVDDIFTSGGHLLLLINDILDLSKVEAGKMTLELEPSQVAVLVQSGLHVIREKAMAHHTRLISDVAAELDDIWVDERKTKQILYNLLSNAVKFTPDGGQVRVAARRVHGDAAKDGKFASYLELSVSDNGIGISDEDQAKLFQPFTQIDSTLARHHEGTGLGLAMVKRLAELHGGAVALKSEPGKGSTFTVWLPWRTQGEMALMIDKTSTHLIDAGIVSRNQVAAEGQLLALVIEDDDKAADLLRLQLESAGFRMKRAVTAESALELAALESPDLITLDIMLPGMDGWEFLERFKQIPRFAAVPVVIISVAADNNRGLSLGASHVLQKPVGREDMLRALEAVGFSSARGVEQRTVLVIDDDPKAVQLLGAYLIAAGSRVLSAFGGEEGVSLARAHNPDLIVLDLMMPEVNGFDVVEALKRDRSTASIPIIIVTSKQITTEDRTRLNGDVLRIVEKSSFNHGRFVGEVRRAMTGKST